jgi:predicted amidohydrolase YtcJ
MRLSQNRPMRKRLRSLWRAALCGSCGVVVGALALFGAARAQPADLIVVNARVATLDAAARVTDALAVRDGRLIAVGSRSAVEALAGRDTRRVDAGGRTVVPGLVDSHIHAIRAALSYATEVNWIGAASIDEAMTRLREAAARARPNAWLIVAGGWTELQFAEKRRPTLAEVQRAAPDNPVYLQMFYSHALMTPGALSAAGVSLEALPQGLTAERDASGASTGWVTGNIIGISALFDRLPRPTYDDNLRGTRLFFSELNRLGITGVIDPGGFNINPPQYAALFQLWRERQLTVRVAYSLFAQNIGAELAEFRNLTQMLPMGYGDDMLRFNGIGERITGAMYNNNQPDAAAKDKFLEVVRWAARQKLAVTIHWQEDASVHHLLDLYEQVNRETPIQELRWSIAHLDNASAETLARMKALGIGWTMQDAMYLNGDRMAAAAGDKARRMPPLGTALRLGLRVGAGTDAHRVASYNPFVALQWMLDGRTVGGLSTRGADETPTREQALRLYTMGSAWFSFDDDRRGTLEPGKWADFAILDQDYFSVPVERIGRTVSLMTVVGGKVVYTAAPFNAAN